MMAGIHEQKLAVNFRCLEMRLHQSLLESAAKDSMLVDEGRLFLGLSQLVAENIQQVQCGAE